MTKNSVDEYIIVMEIVEKKLQVDEDPVKISMNLNDTAAKEINDKNEECSPQKLGQKEGSLVSDNAGVVSDKKNRIFLLMRKRKMMRCSMKQRTLFLKQILWSPML